MPHVTQDDRSSAPLFTSARERRLWLLTLAVVVAVYSTLGLARTLAEVLRDRGLFDSVFVLGFLLIMAAIVTQALKTRPGGAEIGVALGVAAVYLMVFARLGIPEERTHLFEYSVVAVLIFEALTERAGRGRRVPVPALLAVAVTAVIGVLDESIQAVLPSRVFDLRDVGFNALAAVMAVAALVALERVRRRGRPGADRDRLPVRTPQIGKPRRVPPLARTRTQIRFRERLEIEALNALPRRCHEPRRSCRHRQPTCRVDSP